MSHCPECHASGGPLLPGEVTLETGDCPGCGHEAEIAKLERAYRRELWLNHWHNRALYGDDEEMQCAMCRVDYLRDPLVDVEVAANLSRTEQAGQQVSLMQEKEAEIARLQADLAAAKKAQHIAELRANQLHDFCPDHRDKQRDKPCLACSLETANRKLAAARERVAALTGRLQDMVGDTPCACTWTQDEDGVWETACGKSWELNVGTPAENDMRFCHHCGRPLVAVPYREEAPDA